HRRLRQRGQRRAAAGAGRGAEGGGGAAGRIPRRAREGGDGAAGAAERPLLVLGGGLPGADGHRHVVLPQPALPREQRHAGDARLSLPGPGDDGRLRRGRAAVAAGGDAGARLTVRGSRAPELTQGQIPASWRNCSREAARAARISQPRNTSPTRVAAIFVTSSAGTGPKRASSTSRRSSAPLSAFHSFTTADSFTLYP